MNGNSINVKDITVFIVVRIIGLLTAAPAAAVARNDCSINMRAG